MRGEIENERRMSLVVGVFKIIACKLLLHSYDS